MEEAMFSGMVDNLVTQFSSALDCFRELVQNSIDAGSARVDVWMEFSPGEGHEGTIAIHVDDFGEGMDEAIIDNQFTQLFASTKDDDLTKIGKFGIGFVSVFALDPRAILVHTGRSGEYWEVFFHEDRSFTKTLVDSPVEGTQITLFLAGDYHRYMELVRGVPATLTHWCNHSEIELTFEDRSTENPADPFAPPILINEPFAVPGELMQFVEHQGTEIVVAYNHEPVYGFYNRGLTLALTKAGDNVLGSREGRFGHIAFKIKSRYLEHTLARESVMRDHNYEKAMVLLEEAVDGPLIEALFAAIEELTTAPTWTTREMARYGELMAFLAMERGGWSTKSGAKRRLFRSTQGKALSPDDVYGAFRSDGRVLLDDTATDLSAKIEALGVPVVLGRAPMMTGAARHPLSAVSRVVRRVLVERAQASLGGWVREKASVYGGLLGIQIAPDIRGQVNSFLAAPQQVYIPMRIDKEVDDDVADLLARAQVVLRAVEGLTTEATAGVKNRYARLASGVPTMALDAPPFFVVGRKLGPLMAQPPRAERSSPRELRRRMEAAVNRTHPQFLAIREMYAIDPQMAVYLLAKGLLLDDDRMGDPSSSVSSAWEFALMDVALMSAALPDKAAHYSSLTTSTVES